MVNGKNAQYAVFGAYGILLVLILAITYIIVNGKAVPSEFSLIVASIVGAIVGFLGGTKVVTPDISAEIKSQPILSQAEKDTLK